MTGRRFAAATALGLAAVTIALAIVLAAESFPRGVSALVALTAALAAGWYGFIRRGAPRVLGLTAALVLAVVAAVLLVPQHPALVIAAGVSMWLALAASRVAFRIRVPLAPAPRPKRAVLFYNPKSGGGKAVQHHLAEEARARGIKPVELTFDTDLEQLVRAEVAGGADALAMAGGDGSQAVVAKVAAETGLPYACIPAGTRNHFALDLGVDRDDVVGALDALVDGGERVVDLAEVNGQVFVNNVSLGLYAQAVQQPGYRDAKLRTLLATAPRVLGPGGDGPALQWRDPAGESHSAGAAILVSNNRYRLGRLMGSGTRPRIDDGQLGVTIVDNPGGDDDQGVIHRPWREWTTETFDVDAPEPVPAGIDGEAVQLQPPLHFSIRPAALHARVSRNHPGASPSAFQPDSAWEALRALAGIALGHDPRHVPGATG